MTTTAKTPLAASLVRWSGLAAVAAGLIFAGIQPIHPADVLESVTTSTWTVFMSLKLPMCLLFLMGITGIFARQSGKFGWAGVTGFLMLIVSWWLQAGFIFVELFILPVIAGTAPQFVESFLTLANGTARSVDIGAAAPAYAVAGLVYMLGGLLFGIATFRAGVLPRWAGVLLAVASVLTPAAALLPHEIQRYAAIPVALAIAWLGAAVFTDRAAVGRASIVNAAAA